MGISSYMIRVAVDIKVLERNKISYHRFLVSERHSKTKDMDWDELINNELNGLFNHMNDNPNVTKHIIELKLSDNIRLEEIQEIMKSGPTNKKIYRFDRIFISLKDNNLYDKKYDYFHLCFRVRTARYWLSNLGKELLNII